MEKLRKEFSKKLGEAIKSELKKRNIGCIKFSMDNYLSEDTLKKWLYCGIPTLSDFDDCCEILNINPLSIIRSILK